MSHQKALNVIQSSQSDISNWSSTVKLSVKALSLDNRHLKQDDAFNRTWWSVLSIDKLVTWQQLSTERTDGHVVFKASSCLRSLIFSPHLHAIPVHMLKGCSRQR